MPDRSPAGPDTLRILFWNMKVGRSMAAYRSALLILVALCWPHAIVLQEAKRFRGSIPGYQRFAADPKLREDAENCIVLVRRGLPATGYPVLVDNPDGWVHDKPKPARTFYAVLVGWLTLVSVHRCTKGMGGENAVEWEAEHHILAELAGTVGELALVGDHNAHPDRVHPLSPQALAREIRADVVADDEDDIDYALVRGAHSDIRRFRRRFGSDHKPGLLTLTRKENQR